MRGHNRNPKALPSNLGEALRAAGLTQEAFAAQVQTRQSVVSRWVRAERAPSGAARVLISIKLGLPLDHVNGWFDIKAKAAA